jgi:hypothetical protein
MQTPDGITVSAESIYDESQSITDHVMVEVDTPEMAFRRVMGRWPDRDDLQLAGSRRGLWGLVQFARMLGGAR